MPLGKDFDTITTIKNERKEDFEAEEENRKEEKEDFGFYIGQDKQWDSTVLAKLRNEKRPVLTLNLVKGKVDVVDGYQRGHKQEMKFFPVEESDQKRADILNQLKKREDAKNQIEYEEAEMFLKGAIGGRGMIMFNLSYGSEPIYGDIQIREEDPRSILFDHNAIRYDKTDAEHVFRSPWMTKKKAKQLWPDKKSDIESTISEYYDDEAGKVEREVRGDAYKYPGQAFYQKDKSLVRVDEYWYKDYDEIEILINKDKREVLRTEDIGKRKMSGLRKEGYILRPIVKTNIRVKTILGNVQLDDEPSPWTRGLLSKNFPIIPFYAYRIVLDGKEYIQGIVRALKDPQREKNRGTSQYRDIIGRVAHSGYKYEEGALSPEMEGALKERGGEPGFLTKTQPGYFDKFIRTEPPLIDQAILILDDRADRNMDKISGIVGFPSEKIESNVALLTKERQIFTSLIRLFDNLKRTRLLLARYFIDAIQQVYTYHKVLRVIGTDGKPELLEINAPVVDMEGNVIDVLNDVTIGEFDVIATEVPASPTYRLAVAESLIKAMQVFPSPAILKLFFKFMDLPSTEREEILRDLEGMEQQQGQPGAPEGLGGEATRMANLLKKQGT